MIDRLPIIHYWNCPGNHPVLEYYMPQSGKKCNVVGCEGERILMRVAVPSLIAAANEVAAFFFERSEPGNDDNITRQMMDDVITSHDVERIVLDYLKDRNGV